MLFNIIVQWTKVKVMLLNILYQSYFHTSDDEFIDDDHLLLRFFVSWLVAAGQLTETN